MCVFHDKEQKSIIYLHDHVYVHKHEDGLFSDDHGGISTRRHSNRDAPVILTNGVDAFRVSSNRVHVNLYYDYDAFFFK